MIAVRYSYARHLGRSRGQQTEQRQDRTHRHGHRAYDPLRRCILKGKSEISLEHLSAAHELRCAHDAAVIGYSGKREPWVYADATWGPRDGPGNAALASVRAARVVVRALREFSLIERGLIGWIAIHCRSIRRWQLMPHWSNQRTMQTLVGVLDRLAQHFASEIARHGLAV